MFYSCIVTRVACLTACAVVHETTMNETTMYTHTYGVSPPSSLLLLPPPRLVDALSGTHWMTYYESMRTEQLSNGCPGADNKNGQCYLNNMLTESRLGVNAGVHTYLHHVNASGKWFIFRLMVYIIEVKL